MEPLIPRIISAMKIDNRKAKVQWTKGQLKEAFTRQDVNGDGKLSRDEIRKAFNELGSNFGHYRALMALHQVDKDKDGYVSITNQELDDLVDYAYNRV